MADLTAIGHVKVDGHAFARIELSQPGIMIARSDFPGELRRRGVGGVAGNGKAAIAADKGVGHEGHSLLQVDAELHTDLHVP
jgi:hypothetical protein